MTEVSATEAARNFSGLLDAVEHRGEHFAIIRRGRVIAQLDPVASANGRAVKALLRADRPDPGLAEDIAAVRDTIAIERRP